MMLLMYFIVGLFPYYIQIIANLWSQKTLISIDNFNLYVIGYTLFLVAAPYVLSKIDLKDIYGQWCAVGMAILFLIATVMLLIEHLFIALSIRIDGVKPMSTNVAIGFIIINAIIVSIYAWVQSLQLTNKWLKHR
ncbi:hypothetical protein F4T82_12990 [Acinetobacter lwoffii]|uniref:hypothetical protein n=1 Tax=Acinetobacter TaxID=469 RepID=UPI000900170F|nr:MULTISPECIES: hypothetical protein [Acinetobacter]MRA04615.1 hypothetical protein [Acinetobacter lwoffii]OIU83080.1 hypothetical protein BFN00_12255 [Acinetobacter sp. AR2-3]